MTTTNDTSGSPLMTTLDQIGRVALIAGIIGLALCLLGLFIDSAGTLQSYLFGFLYWAGIGMGCLGVLMIQFTLKGAWGAVTRRLLEAGALTIPLMAPLFIPVLFGMSTLYPWAQPDVVANDPLLQHKSGYLNAPFFILRIVVYFAIWSGLALTLRRWSLREDAGGDPRLAQRMQNLSVIGLVVMSITATFALIDWIMSLEPRWSSTIYAVMVAMGGVLAAFAFVVALLTRLRQVEPLKTAVTPGVLTDLGNILLAGILFWAYLAFSQYLVIWTGNLSEEIPWYLNRLGGGWQVVLALIVALHFIAPFVLLLSAQVKRRAGPLGLVAGLLVVMHLVDAFWIVIPALRPDGFALRWTDFAAPIGIGGLWIAAFVWQLKQRPLLARASEGSSAEVAHTKEAPANG